MKEDGDHCRRKCDRSFKLGGVEIEELRRTTVRRIGVIRGETLAFTVPSRVLAMTSRFKASEARPVMHLSPRLFELELRAMFAASRVRGPTLKALRLIPDCMFHIYISPVDDPAIPKLPQDVTQTAYRVHLVIERAFIEGQNSDLDRTNNFLSFAFCKREAVLAQSLVEHSPRSGESLVRVCRQDVVPIFCASGAVSKSGNRRESERAYGNG